MLPEPVLVQAISANRGNVAVKKRPAQSSEQNRARVALSDSVLKQTSPAMPNAEAAFPDHENRPFGTIRGRLLAVVTVVAVIWLLRVSASVTVPLASGLFLIAVFFPLERRLERSMPRWAALVLTVALFLTIVAAFAGALWFAVDMVAKQVPQYSDEFKGMIEQARAWAQQHGLPFPGGDGNGGSASSGTVMSLSKQAVSFLGGFLLVLAFFVLGLLEVPEFHEKLRRNFGTERAHGAMQPFHRITSEFLRYVGIRTLVGLITGVLVGVSVWFIGLDFAFVWGLLNFLLNYIPTIGSVLAIFPPVLFALVQFDGFTQPLLVLLAAGGVQLVMGQYVDPLLEGRALSLSAFVVLLSVVFWGWVWGIVGALLSVPLTVVIVITCSQYERTRWVAGLLAGADADVNKREDEG